MSKFDLNTIYEWPIMTRGLIILLLCAVVFYLGFYLDLSSMNNKLTSEKNTENDLKQQIKLVVDKESQVTHSLSRFDAMTTLQQQWQKSIINHANLPELLNEILKIGANNNLHFSHFSPGNPIKEGSYLKIPIKIVVAGDYHQVSSFMSQIANLPWIVVIGNFSLSTQNKAEVLGAELAKEADTQKWLTTLLQLEVYYIAEKSKASPKS